MSDDKSRIFINEEVKENKGLDLEDIGFLDFSGEDSEEEINLDGVVGELDLGSKTELDLEGHVSRDFNLSMSEANDIQDDLIVFPERELDSDKDRFEEIINRMGRYNSNKVQRKDKKKRLKEFSSAFVKKVLDKRENSKVILTEKQITAMSRSARAIAEQLGKSTIVSDMDDSILRTLEITGFPMEVLYKIGNDLEWELQKLVQSVKLEIDEIDNARKLMMQSLTLTMDNDYKIDKGIFLTDVELIKYDMVRRKQRVVCPTCGVEVEHNLIGFSKTLQELGQEGYKTLFEVRPLVCMCGDLLVLSEDSTKMLDELMNQQRLSITSGGSVTEKESKQVLQPTSNVLSKIPEIELQGRDINNEEEEVKMQDLVMKYNNHSRRIIPEEMKKIFKDTRSAENRLRYDTLVHNILIKDNVLGDNIEEMVVSSTLQIPIVIEINNIKKRIRGVDRNILNLAKVVKVMDYLLKDNIEEETEFDTHTSIEFVNEILLTELNSKALSEEDYKGKLVAGTVLKSIKNELKKVLFKKEDLEQILKSYKEEFLNNILVYYLPTKTYTSGVKDFRRLYQIFETNEEIEDFRLKAIEALSISNWYQKLLEINRGRLDRSNKAYKEYEEVKTIKKTLEFVTSPKKEVKEVKELGNLFSLDIPEIDNCLSELNKRNSKYRFIYKIIELVSNYSGDPYIDIYMEQVNKYIEEKYRIKQKVLTLEQFEKYFILTDLGFDKDEVQDLVTMGEARMDCRSIAVVRKGMSIKDYITNFKTMTKYSGEYVTLDKNCYEILLVMRKLEQWSIDNTDDMHRIIKYNILSYVYSEFKEGEELFKYCDTLIDHDYSILSKFTYNNILTEMHKGKMLLKDIFEESAIMNVELQQEIDGEIKKNVKDILILENLTTMDKCDAIRRIMEETDVSYINTNSLDIYLRFLLGKDLLREEFKLDIEPLLPESIKEEVEIYYVILNKNIEAIDVITKSTNLKLEELKELYSERLICLCNTVKKVNVVTFENLRMLIGERLGIEF